MKHKDMQSHNKKQRQLLLEIPKNLNTLSFLNENKKNIDLTASEIKQVTLAIARLEKDKKEY